MSWGSKRTARPNLYPASSPRAQRSYTFRALMPSSFAASLALIKLYPFPLSPGATNGGTSGNQWVGATC